ncbi:endonuclease/exonuclease/phosphatase [Maribacter sp. MAR_2009_72]|uniref:endonuclease/exonuclease/phosphatase family protein n=1 Tax=Maribacter sp. MAR_2009_72 TaxID=1250050 RepID=UPI00119BF7FA|nr:endonuclease/exonuclease/phosphatase [Maribacter sp. MAR_2009_72]TVZ16002.1 Endonuclease/Exonuclease/phosphatase family protein [Maribacter sp. MAR_2009_72]
MVKHHIYWWNLENLFDIENSPRRSQFLNDHLGSELHGWNTNILNKKITNLTSIISQFNDNQGPDILGVCEVENEFVIELLITAMNVALNRQYAFVISESEDKRGIDTALIYDTEKYGPEQLTFSLRIIKRNSTRDLFQVHINTANGNKLICILNHWPSRSGGELTSEPFRIMVAENLSYWIERIYEEQGDDAAILLMGDFNDNPFNKSITNYLMAINNKALVKSNRVRLKYFYNVMHRFMDDQIGTFVFGNEYNLLDQFMVSKSILSEKPTLPFKLSSAAIVDFPELTSGSYNKPVKFGRPNASKFNLNGYSDHLPIKIVLSEKALT